MNPSGLMFPGPDTAGAVRGRRPFIRIAVGVRCPAGVRGYRFHCTPGNAFRGAAILNSARLILPRRRADRPGGSSVAFLPAALFSRQAGGLVRQPLKDRSNQLADGWNGRQPFLLSVRRRGVCVSHLHAQRMDVELLQCAQKEFATRGVA